jgi:hypothetical protein
MIDTKWHDQDLLMDELKVHIGDLIAEGIDPASIYVIVTFEEGYWRGRITWVGNLERHQAQTLKTQLTAIELRILRRAKVPANSD